MRVHVIHAHPVETSYNRALFDAVVETLTANGHTVDPLNLYDEDFQAVLSRTERLEYHDVPGNLTRQVKPYVDRLMNTDAMVFVHPVWNYGYPAILKGYFDRIFLPGVSFILEGGDRFRTMIMGDPPRRLARRWAWVTFGTLFPPKYLAFYDMNNATPERLKAFIEKVRSAMARL